MSYTLRQAAKATGKSKMTIQRAIKSGKISAIRKESDSYNIDPAELHRVFPPVSESDTPSRNELQTDTPSDTRLLRREIEIRDEKISAIEAERDQERRTLKTTIEDLREDRDRWRAQTEQATRLLTDQRREYQRPPEHQTDYQLWRRYCLSAWVCWRLPTGRFGKYNELVTVKIPVQGYCCF